MIEESFNIEVAAMRGGDAGEGDEVEAGREGSEDPGLISGSRTPQAPVGWSQLFTGAVGGITKNV